MSGPFRESSMIQGCGKIHLGIFLTGQKTKCRVCGDKEYGTAIQYICSYVATDPVKMLSSKVTIHDPAAVNYGLQINGWMSTVGVTRTSTRTLLSYTSLATPHGMVINDCILQYPYLICSVQRIAATEQHAAVVTLIWRYEVK